jgi:ubiquinone/menaquinone biosynthesis C-methylase UbiE
VQEQLGSERYYGDPAVVEYYGKLDSLLAAERAVLEELRPRLPRLRMLDLGVGAGRTVPFFAPLVREYVGVDISPRMIELCRVKFASNGWDDVQWAVADVRDMRDFEDARFDFVLFSFNGLDSVGGHEDRRRALGEIRRVSAPGGVLALSTHSLAVVSEWLSFRRPVRAALRAPRSVRKVAALPRELLQVAVMRVLNPPLTEVARSRRAILADTRHRTRIVRNYYILPEEQLRELEAAGFSDPRVITASGEHLRGADVARAREPWVHYICDT